MLANSLKIFPFLKKNHSPVLLQRVKWSPFRHYHCFYYHSQCFRPKIKFVCGGVVLADSQKLFSFLKIKLLLYYFKRLTGGHLEITIIFYYHSKCLKTKIEFVFGGVVLADSPKVHPYLKMKPPLCINTKG